MDFKEYLRAARLDPENGDKVEYMTMRDKMLSNVFVDGQRNSPSVCATYNADVTEFIEVFDSLRAQCGYKLTLNAVMLKVLSEGLKAAPRLNAHFIYNHKATSGQYIIKKHIDVSMAICKKDGSTFQMKLLHLEDKSLKEIALMAADARRRLENADLEEVMFEAYALLQMADGVVTYNGAGHAMMISQNNPVRTENGIDPEESYVLVHEQFTGNTREELTRVDAQTGLTVYCLGGVDRKYTYSQLFKKGYLPITIKELIDPAEVPPIDIVDSVKKPSADTVTSGSLNSLHKIAAVTVRITDSTGAVVQEATCFTKEAEHNMFRMENFEDPVEQRVMKGSLDLKTLPAGSYRCVTECLMGSGETIKVRDFEFTAP